MRRWLAIALLLSGCGDEDDTPPPPSPSPTAPVEVAAASGLTGAYELVWMEEPGQPRAEMPGALISTLPGCMWARWGWEFGEAGALTVSNQMLCRAPTDLGGGYGGCRAAFETAVGWTGQGFSLPVPVRASSRFENLRRNRGGFDTTTVRCNVSIGAMTAALVDPVAGASPDRPAEVTLQLQDGGRMRLRAVDAVEPDHAALIAQIEAR
ncbi:MAG: hypothetical protein RLP09_48120 [Sandaracinaceae bacterium]|nr:hypothetical protein [Myxococcales bacterium]